MEKRIKYIEDTAEKATAGLFNNPMLHPEFKYGFILGMVHADRVPFIKNHKEYDTISKDEKRVASTIPVWDNDLRMCPSQCYCYFETLGNKYCIYLRWRWDDPWSAEVVPCNEDWEFDYNSDWRELDVPFVTHDDYKRLQKRCVKKVLDIFDNIKWRKYELDG